MNNINKLLTLLAIATISQAYRILVIVPIPSGSHAILGEACVKNFVKAGHEVVYVTAMPGRLAPHPKLLEVDVSSNAKYFPTDMIKLTNFLDKQETNPSTVHFLDKATLYCAETVKHDAVQKVLNDGKKFDVVIAEWMFSEMYAGLSALLDCPLVWLSSMEPHGLILSLVDDSPNPSYTADFGINSVVPFSFYERAQQLAMRIFVVVYREYYIYFKETNAFNKLYAPMMEKLGKPLPSYEELRYNASLVLSNSHMSLGEATCLPQNFISIGGYHVDTEIKPLSEDLKKIMDNAKHGVIYFSMGSILKSKDFPQKIKTEILNMLGSLKQTVLWKFEEDISNTPSNVHVLKWASQQSILAHPNCVLFITHGGLLSLIESIHYAVPVIGVPAFADQFVNIKRAVKKGFAANVKLSYNLAEDLKAAIEEVLGNARYTQKAKETSFAYHHRPSDPRKELVHWIEHVIQTQGAPMLRSPALLVPFYQKYYLDLAFLILIVLLFLRKIVLSIKMKLFTRNMDNNAKRLSKKKVN